MQTHVALERRGDVANLVFACDEPGKPITLDLLVLDELAGCLQDIRAAGEGLRAVVVQSDSPRYFVVGANIHALKALNSTTIATWVQRGHDVFNSLASLPLPVISLVNGYALGGGLELALACDLILASEGAKLGQPEATLGVVAGWGGSYRLPQRVGLALAKRLFFTGTIVDAPAALEMGLVDFVGSPDQVAEYLQSLLEGIRQCSPLAVAQMKGLIDHSPHITLEQSCHAEAAASSVCMASEDTQARIRRFLERRR